MLRQIYNILAFYGWLTLLVLSIIAVPSDEVSFGTFLLIMVGKLILIILASARVEKLYNKLKRMKNENGI